MTDQFMNELQLRANKSKNFKEDELRLGHPFHRRSLSNLTDSNECRSEISDGIRFELDNDGDYFNQNKNKKDPQNKHFNFFYEIQLYGKYDYVFEFKGDMTKKEFVGKTLQIRSFPYHLRYTLFANEKIKEIRQKGFSYASIPFEELKDKGNKMYKRGRFREAIDLYIEAYGLLKWIEFKEPQNYTNLFQKKTPIVDDQILECKCIEDDDECYKFSIVSILLCLSYAYIELRHYSSAIECLNECDLIISDRESYGDIYFRKSQSIMYNKKSDLAQLSLALEDIKKALSICPNEQIYYEHYQILLKFMENIKIFKFERMKKFIFDASNYYVNNKGNVAKIRSSENLFKTSEKQYKIFKEMKLKYEIALKYYNETKNEMQLDFAYKELENFLDNYHNHKYFFKLDTVKVFEIIFPEVKFELHPLVMRNRREFLEFLGKYKYKVSDTIFQQGNYNIDLIRYAIDKINRENPYTPEANEMMQGDNRIKFGNLVAGCKVFKEVNTGLSLVLTISLFLLSAVFIFTHFYLYVKNPAKFFQTFHKNYFIA